MSCLQLELFERTEIEIVKSDLKDLEKSVGNVRRGMFSRHDELEKKQQEMREEMEKLKDALHLMKEEMKNYEAALFPTSPALTALPSSPLFSTDEGVRSTFLPISSFITSSHASSTGLSLPKK